MFSVATNFDDALPGRISGREVDELFGACDDTPVGHGRPRASTPPVSWRRLARHVASARSAGIGFNLLMNPICLDGRELNIGLEKKIRHSLRRAQSIGVTAVTVAHPWVLELARETSLRTRVSVFVSITTVEEAKYWAGKGAQVLCLDSQVLSRDFPLIQRIGRQVDAEIELPVNIGCLLRCPLSRNHAARLSHSSKPGSQPLDPFVIWCRGEKCRDPYHLIRSDFIRPEDVHRYEDVGVKHFKIVDRACSTEALVERVIAYHERRWNGDLLDLIGPRGRPPRRRRLPILDALRHLGVRGSLGRIRQGKELLDNRIPWVIENQKLDALLLPNGCRATNCEACGHCARLAESCVVRGH